MILSEEDKAFILKHLNDDTTKIILALPPEKRWLVHQIIARKKVNKKLPTWTQNEAVIFPQSLSLEQSSSEITAKYKSSLISGKTVVDATGGMGVDSFYFSFRIENIIYVEQNSVLAELASHNFGVLGVKNITIINKNCIDFLNDHTQKIDWIYIDPARRSTNHKRVSGLSDCEPDITQLLPLFFKHSSKILLKASPLLDIQQAVLSLEYVKTIHVLAVENDCKELLIELDTSTDSTVEVLTFNFPNQYFNFNLESEKRISVTFSYPLKYLYEPNAAVLKAGAFKSVANYYQVFKIAPHSHLYTSEYLIPNFCGRTFEILAVVKVETKAISPYLKGNKASITTRNFPMGAEELRQKLKIKDGGDIYLMATTLLNGDKRIIICMKPKSGIFE